MHGRQFGLLFCLLVVLMGSHAEGQERRSAGRENQAPSQESEHAENPVDKKGQDLALALDTLRTELVRDACQGLARGEPHEQIWKNLCQEVSPDGGLNGSGWKILEQTFCKDLVTFESPILCPLTLERLPAFEQKCLEANGERKEILCGTLFFGLLVQKYPEADVRALCDLRYLAACIRLLTSSKVSPKAEFRAATNMCQAPLGELILVRGYQPDFEPPSKFFLGLNSLDELNRLRIGICLSVARKNLQRKRVLPAASLFATVCEIGGSDHVGCQAFGKLLGAAFPKEPQKYRAFSCRGLSQDECRHLAVALTHNPAAEPTARSALNDLCGPLRHGRACDVLLDRYPTKLSDAKSLGPWLDERARNCAARGELNCVFYGHTLHRLKQSPDSSWLKMACLQPSSTICLTALSEHSRHIQTLEKGVFDPSILEKPCRRYPKFEVCQRWRPGGRGQSSPATPERKGDRPDAPGVSPEPNENKPSPLRASVEVPEWPRLMVLVGEEN